MERASHTVERQDDAGWLHALATRLRGPGGLYNLGNAIGLISGIIFAILAARGQAQGMADAVYAYLAGDPGAVSLTMAMVVFFVGGEYYHRAYTHSANRARCDRLMRIADLLSGVGAMLLFAALVFYGGYLGALVSTLLLAGGKFGNALTPAGELPIRLAFPKSGTTRSVRLDLFRLLVPFSRLPAMIGLGSELLQAAGDGVVLPIMQSGTLLFCFFLWLGADLLLMRGPSARKTQVAD